MAAGRTGWTHPAGRHTLSFYQRRNGRDVSALDDLVQQLQAAVTSLETAQTDVAQAATSAGDAVQAAAAFGRDTATAETDALRADVDEQAAALAGIRDAVADLVQRAVALQGGGGG